MRIYTGHEPEPIFSLLQHHNGASLSRKEAEELLDILTCDLWLRIYSTPLEKGMSLTRDFIDAVDTRHGPREYPSHFTKTVEGLTLRLVQQLGYWVEYHPQQPEPFHVIPNDTDEITAFRRKAYMDQIAREKRQSRDDVKYFNQLSQMRSEAGLGSQSFIYIGGSEGDE